MPEQQSYRVTRPDGTVQVFPPGTPEEVLMAWYNGDDKVAPRGEINPMAMLGQETPPGMDLKGIGGDIGAVIEFLSGFTPFRPIPAALGMGASAIGELMQGGDAGDAAVSAGITGAGSGLGRLISQTGTALGLTFGGADVDNVWKTAGDFYNLRPHKPTSIGQGRAIQREVTASGKALGRAQDAAPDSMIGDLGGAAGAVRQKSLQARGYDPTGFKMGLDDAERQFLRSQLIDAGRNPQDIAKLDDWALQAVADQTSIPMSRVGSIKQDSQKRGMKALEARKDHTTTDPSTSSQAQHADEVASRAREIQHSDRATSAALKRSERAQTVREVNNDVIDRNRLRRQFRDNSGVASVALRRPRAASMAGQGLDYFVRALLNGGKLPQGGGDR